MPLTTISFYKILRLVPAGLGFIFLAGSCETNEPECYEPIIVSANSLFQTYDSVQQMMPDSTFTMVIKPKDTLLKSPAFLALDLDSISYYVGGINTGTVGVALNPETDSMRYRVQTDTASSQYDTLTFFYQPILHFVSNSCGYTNYFKLDSIHTTGNLFDSAVLSNVEVTSDIATRHILLYLRR